jgi:hypothetical protein
MRTGEAQVCPALCEPVLEQAHGDLSPVQRRGLAVVYERWARQLRFSADFIEKTEQSPPEEALTDRDGDAQLLELAARLEQQAGKIRGHLGLNETPKPVVAQVDSFAEN